MTSETAIAQPAGRPPKEPGIDHTVSLLREGYRFIGRRCEKLDTDIFETRLMLQPVYCIYGREAAEFFYGGERFGRVGAMPPGVLRLLQDIGSVQQLDGPPHHHRKALFLEILGDHGVQSLARHVEEEWHRRLPAWQQTEEIVLFDELRALLTGAVLAWAGCATDREQVARRTVELSEMIEATGSIGPRKVGALLRRRRCEAWARQVIEDIRGRALRIADDAPAAVIAHHRDDNGGLLDLESAVVELLNLLRPTVAIAHFMVFAAKAMHEHPDERDRLRDGDGTYRRAFVEEIRRMAPFFPFIGGRSLHDLQWRGISFPQGTWMLLDLYGTNHDPRIWSEPHRFRPDRFQGAVPGPYDLIPQGGGEMATSHRCPGEPATATLLQTVVRLLADLSYEVPEQDLTVDLSRIPALPASRFVIRIAHQS